MDINVKHLQIKNRCVSANPTDPDFCAYPEVFIAFLKENKKIFYPFSGKWTYDLKYVNTATIIFNLPYVLILNVCHYLVFEMN